MDAFKSIKIEIKTFILFFKLLSYNFDFGCKITEY